MTLFEKCQRSKCGQYWETNSALSDSHFLDFLRESLWELIDPFVKVQVVRASSVYCVVKFSALHQRSPMKKKLFTIIRGAVLSRPRAAERHLEPKRRWIVPAAIAVGALLNAKYSFQFLTVSQDGSWNANAQTI